MSNNFENNQNRPTRTTKKAPATSTILGVAFGIFMVIVYVGMGVLLIINFFNWRADWDWTRWVVGIALIIYGFYRGYRTFAILRKHGNMDDTY